ncbi:MAG: hypothetical protein AB8G05_17655 [Oligoflexales bacterium]
MKDHGVSRSDRFEIEQAKLLQLPGGRYVIKTWKKAKVHPDSTVQVIHNFYSIPHKHIGKVVNVRISKDLIEVFDDSSENLAVHQKLSGKGKKSLSPGHYPEEKVQQAQFDLTKAKTKAQSGFYKHLSEKQLAKTPRKEVTEDTNIKTVFCKIGEEGVVYLDLINETLGTSLWHGSPAEIWSIEGGKLKSKNNWSFTAVSPSGSTNIGQMSWEHRPAIQKKKYSRNNWSWRFGISLKTINSNMSFNDSDEFFSNIPLFGRVFYNKTIKCKYNLSLEKYNDLLKFHPVHLSEPFDVLEKDLI